MKKSNLSDFSKICQFQTVPNNFRGCHLSKTHSLSIDEYEKLVISPVELQNFKRTNGFTDKFGQCGFCMKQFTEILTLKRHKLKWHEGKGVKFVEGNGSKVNNQRVAKLDNKKTERKGVS